MNNKDFQAIFHPESIAVIGASSDPMKFGGRAYMVVKERSNNERVYPVNPAKQEIEGIQCYTSISEIEEDIDFAIITLPTQFVVQAVAECAAKKVKAIAILAAGFKETGEPEGKAWEAEIEKIVAHSGMRLIGPNCFGVYSPGSALTILPGPDFPMEGGPIGVMSQSGGFTGVLVRRIVEMGLRISRAVSYGNACDLNEHDFMDYFKNDGQTEVIAAYIEGIRDGARFMKRVQETVKKKPVIIWKGGLTGQGSRAVASHTASLAGDNRIWKGFFQQTGATPTFGATEMVDLIVGFNCLKNFRARNVSVVGGGGAVTVAAADALEKAGLSILPFDEETRKSIGKYLPPHGNSYKNPVDMGTPVFIPQTLSPILEIVASNDQVEAVIVEQMVLKFIPGFDQELADVITKVKEMSGKPFIVSLPFTSSASSEIMVEETRRKYREFYLSKGIPVFDNLEQAAGVLGKVVKYYERLAIDN
ncbi:CoA-binding protein [Thermodesulfobacteriota bacterium]